MKIILPILLLAVLLTNSAVAGQATRLVKFYGVFNGQDLGSGEGLVTQSGVGNFTDMGNSTFISVGAYTQAKHQGCLDSATFERTFTTSRGDSIRFGIIGETCYTGDADFYLFNGTYTADGGSGRYQGVSGTGQVQTLINSFTSSFQGTMKGTLILQVQGLSVRSTDPLPMAVAATSLVSALLVSAALVTKRIHLW